MWWATTSISRLTRLSHLQLESPTLPFCLANSYLLLTCFTHLFWVLPLDPVLMLSCCGSWHAGIACCCSSRNFSSGHRLAALCLEKWTGAWSQSHRSNSDLLFRKTFPNFHKSVQSQVPMRLSASGPSLQGLFVTIACFASLSVTLASWNCFLSAWAVCSSSYPLLSSMKMEHGQTWYPHRTWARFLKEFHSLLN